MIGPFSVYASPAPLGRVPFGIKSMVIVFVFLGLHAFFSLSVLGGDMLSFATAYVDTAVLSNP